MNAGGPYRGPAVVMPPQGTTAPIHVDAVHQTRRLNLKAAYPTGNETMIDVTIEAVRSVSTKHDGDWSSPKITVSGELCIERERWELLKRVVDGAFVEYDRVFPPT